MNHMNEAWGHEMFWESVKNGSEQRRQFCVQDPDYFRENDGVVNYIKLYVTRF